MIDSVDGCGLLQSTDAAAGQRQEKDALTTLEDLQRSQGSSAFRTVKETFPITAAAGVSQHHSTAADPDKHALWKCSDELFAKSSSLASAAAEVSLVAGDEQPSQLQDVEPDDNNNNSTLPDSSDKQPVQQTDGTDVPTPRNCAANCSRSTAAPETKSNDTLGGACQSKTNDSTSDENTTTHTKQADSSISATETTFLGENSSTVVSSVLNRQSSMPTNVFELDFLHQHQQLNQSSIDQQQVGGQTVFGFQQQEPVDELEQLFSSSSAYNISLDQHSITPYDADIPEIPLSCIRVNQFVRECEDADETSDSSRPAGDAESENAEDSEVDIEPASGEGTESSGQAISAKCPVECQKDGDVDVCDLGDSDETVDAFRRSELASGPLDLTCSRARSTSDPEAASSAGQDAVSQTSPPYGNVNMYNYCPGWSVAHQPGSYGAAWPPHPYPCYGHPGVYPGSCAPPVFPGLPWQFPGAEPFPPPARRRSSSSSRRRQPAPSSCSRVDGIRSAKVSTDGDTSKKKDKVPRSTSRRGDGVRSRKVSADGESSKKKDRVPSSSGSSVPATEVPGQETCSSGGEVIAHQSSSTSTADGDQIAAEHTRVQTTACEDSDLTISDPPDSPFVDAASDSPAAARVAPSRSRGGGRGRGRTPRNSASNQTRASVEQPDDDSQPAVRGKKRGRPRKHRGDVRATDRSPRETGGVSGQTGRGQHLRHNDGRFRTAADGCGVGRSHGAGTSRRIGRSRGRKSPDAASSPAADRRQPSPTEDAETHGAPTTSTNATSGTTSSPSGVRPANPSSAEGNHDVIGDGTATTNCDGESQSDRMARGPIATSGSIIKKPRSRKQSCRVQSNTKSTENAAGAGGANLSQGSWQPLVTESSITSLLDTLTVAASDRDVPERTLTSCDGRLQPNTSTPFVVLERADLNRCAFHLFWYIEGAFLPSLMLLYLLYHTGM